MVKVNSHISSYNPNDAIFLLKDISDLNERKFHGN